MNTSKLIIAAIVAGIASFFIGWVVYGMLLMDFMKSNTLEPAKNLAKTEMVWWALIGSNLLMGFFYAYIFERWAKIRSFMGGMMAGGTLGLILGAMIDMQFYSMYQMSTGTGYIVDVVASTVMSALVGGIAGFMLGLNRTE